MLSDNPLSKALKDIPVGGNVGGSMWKYDYSHTLPQHLQKEGYSIHVSDMPHPQKEDTDNVEAEFRHNGERIGSISGTVGAKMVEGAQRRALGIGIAEIVGSKHRGKGLGMAGYEALMAHAANVSGATHVAGSMHSSMAHAVHSKLAAKHGLGYKGVPNIGSDITQFPDQEAWERKENGAFDDKYQPYGFSLLGKSDDCNLSLEDCVLAGQAMMGNTFKYFDAAKFLAGASDIPLDALRKALSEHDEDPEAAALVANGFEVNQRNRDSLRLVSSANCFAKSEQQEPLLPEPPPQFTITAYNKDGEAFAAALQIAFDNGQYSRVSLNGKHSNGAVVARDPQGSGAFLLKPGISEASPALGMADLHVSPCQREAAFWHCAMAFGLGDMVPQCELVMVDNHQTAAFRLLPLHYKNLGLMKNDDPNIVRVALEPYRASGYLHKLAILYWILGEVDAHSSNIMYSKNDSRCYFIDHGASMAGPNFNPAFDENSYIPYFLRAWTGNKFKTLGPVERSTVMPSVPSQIEKIVEEWVAGISPQKLAWELRKYGIDPTAMLARLNQVKKMPVPYWQSINRLWSGVGV